MDFTICLRLAKMSPFQLKRIKLNPKLILHGLQESINFALRKNIIFKNAKKQFYYL